MLTPAERRLAGRIGALRIHASGKTTTTKARRAFLARFEREVDPDNRLTPEERERRAGFARRAYFAKLAFRSAQARRAQRDNPPQTGSARGAGRNTSRPDGTTARSS
jgi:hypothetical protein